MSKDTQGSHKVSICLHTFLPDKSQTHSGWIALWNVLTCSESKKDKVKLL